MAKYEATSPVSFIAGETVASGLRGKLAVVTINGGGRVARSGSNTSVPIAGVFAQDSMITGEPVTVDQLQGKVTVIAQAGITAGHIVYIATGNTDANRGKVNAAADWASGHNYVGIALEDAAADGDRFQMLAQPLGTID